MKKLKMLFLGGIVLLLLTGCSCEIKNDAGKAVQDYLNLYIKEDNVVIEQLDSYVANEELSETQKVTYKNILTKQYKDMKFEILNEDYEGDNATVSAKITVYDLYKVQKDAEDYLENSREEFSDETGNYDRTIFLDYKLNKMETNTDTIDYTIDFYVIKTDGEWVVQQPSALVLEKIHGIYNYDNK